MYNAKNYKEGPDKTVIDGELVVNGTLTLGEGSAVVGLPTAANVAESTATSVADLKSTVNELLGALKDAGLMEPDGESDGE